MSYPRIATVMVLSLLLGAKGALAGHSVADPPGGDPYVFTNVGGDHLWSNADNWNQPEEPGPGHVAWINFTTDEAVIDYAAPSIGELVIGQGGGDGAVRVTTDGSITTSHVNIGWGDNRNGVLEIDDGSFTTTGDLRIGREAGGTATLNISGGELRMPTPNTHIRLSALGNTDSTTSFLNISGTADVLAEGGLLVSRFAGDGTAVISGGSVVLGHNIWVNANSAGSPSTGSLTVSGGSLHSSTDFEIGRGDNPGNATVTISGTAAVNARHIRVGTVGGAGGTGTNSLVVSGGSLTSPTGGLQIGHHGTGPSSAEITGGTVSIAGATVLSNFDPNSTAPDSSLTITGGTFQTLQIGVGASTGTGRGHLTIGGNAVVTTQNHIFLRGDGKGTMTVDGSAASITLNRVGSTGFEVTNGSVVNFNADAGGFSTVHIPQSTMRFSGPDGILNVDATPLGVGTYDLFTFDSYFSGDHETPTNRWGTENLAFAPGLTGSVLYNPTSIQLRVIPEPAALCLLAIAGAALVLRRQRILE